LCYLWIQKKGRTTNPPPPCFDAIVGSRIDKNPDPGSRIRNTAGYIISLGINAQQVKSLCLPVALGVSGDRGCQGVDTALAA
jgi:hypothetical protein